MSDSERPRPRINPEIARRILAAAEAGPVAAPVPPPDPGAEVVESAPLSPPSPPGEAANAEPIPDPRGLAPEAAAIREQAAALHQLAIREIQAGDQAGARRHLEEGLALERGIASPADTAATLVMLGQIYFSQDDREEGLELARESLELFRSLQAREVATVEGIVAQMEALIRQDAPGGSRDLLRQGISAMQAGDGETAGNLFDASLQLAVQHGDGGVAAAALHHLGLLLFSAGHLDEAASAVRDSIELNRTIDDLPSLAAGLALQGQILVEQNQTVEGLRVLRESLLTWNAAGMREQAAQVKELIAEIKAESGER